MKWRSLASIPQVVVVLFIAVWWCVGAAKRQNLYNDWSDDTVMKNRSCDLRNVNAFHRIVGGKPISIRTAPWQVAVMRDSSFVCGGSIVSRRLILTAAHCVPRPGKYWVRAGTRYFRNNRAYDRTVTVVVRHRRYNRHTTANDIAMLRLDRPLRYSRRVSRIRLAGRGTRTPRLAYVTGWGRRSEQSNHATRGLRGVLLNAVQYTTCARIYQKYNFRLPARTVCAIASGRDSCQGDSGGPLVRSRLQYGIVSFGVGCARQQFPGVYTDVRRHRRWIRGVARRYG